MSERLWFLRTERGIWFPFSDRDDAIRHARLRAGDRRKKPPLYEIVPDGFLYVGPRPRRGTTWHVAHICTSTAAELLGFASAAVDRVASEVR